MLDKNDFSPRPLGRVDTRFLPPLDPPTQHVPSLVTHHALKFNSVLGVERSTWRGRRTAGRQARVARAWRRRFKTHARRACARGIQIHLSRTRRWRTEVQRDRSKCGGSRAVAVAVPDRRRRGHRTNLVGGLCHFFTEHTTIVLNERITRAVRNFS